PRPAATLAFRLTSGSIPLVDSGRCQRSISAMGSWHRSCHNGSRLGEYRMTTHRLLAEHAVLWRVLMVTPDCADVPTDRGATGRRGYGARRRGACVRPACQL